MPKSAPRKKKSKILKPTVQKPLRGLKVLDASRVLAGPYCAQLLADLGAGVTKIERPGAGDETRSWGPPFNTEGVSAYYLSANRGKNVVRMDLTTEQNKFASLAKQSDVLIHNYLPDVANKLGLAFSALKKLNPKLIVCSISGFGIDSSWAKKPGYDFAIQALSGFMAITGPADGAPSKVGVAVTDVLTALYACNAIQAAIIARSTTKKGCLIDMALMDCAVSAQVNLLQAYLMTKKVPARQGNAHLQIVPYQMFATSDSWMVVAVGNDGQWKRFCQAAGRSDLEHDAKFKENHQRVTLREELIPKISEEMKKRTNSEWSVLLTIAEVPHAAVQNYQQVCDMQLAKERAWFTEKKGTIEINHPFKFRTSSS